MKIILGSASPRRKQLLAELFPDVEVRPKDLNEDYHESLAAENIALFLAEEKSKGYIHELNPNEILITADTIVWLENEMLGKPKDKNEALLMLKKLQGRNHQVYTGVCITRGTKNSEEVSNHVGSKCFSVRSDVWFRKMNDNDLVEYIDQYKPFDKAGSYGAQECLPEKMNPLSEKESAFLLRIGKPDLFSKSLAVKEHAKVPIIEKIEGSYFNVMGLPIVELYEMLNVV